MNPSEAGKVLAVAALYDARIRPADVDQAAMKAVLWAEALAPDMSAKWAQKAVAHFYKDQTDVLMPAHLNTAWKAHKRAESDRQASERQRQEIEAAEQAAVPMPDDVKRMLADIARKKAVPND